MKNEEKKKMKKGIVPVMLALFLTLCVGILYITPAANALDYGPWSNLGNIAGTGSIGTSILGIYSLVYAGNHEVYGFAATPSFGTHLFSINLDSYVKNPGCQGGFYPSTSWLATAVTDLGAPPWGAQFTTPVGLYQSFSGSVLTPGFPPGPYPAPYPALGIYGGARIPGTGADFIYYSIDLNAWFNLGVPPCLPSGPTPAQQAIFALATGMDGTIYGGTGYWVNLPSYTSSWTYLFAYSPASNSYRLCYQVTTGDYYISAVAAGIHGEIYFLSQPSGTLWYYNPSVLTNKAYPVGSANGYTALTVDLHGNVWLGDNRGNLYEYVAILSPSIPISPPTLIGSIVTPGASSLTTMGMTAGMHGIIYMAVYDSANGYGYVVWYDPRKPWSPGAVGTNSAMMNPASENVGLSFLPSVLAAPYSLVECNEHGTIFCGTGGYISNGYLFYYYESGNPDLYNEGHVSGSSLIWAASQFGWDPPSTGLPLSMVAAVAITVAAVAVASVYKLGGKAKRKKR
jgi:hypothetical protein